MIMLTDIQNARTPTPPSKNSVNPAKSFRTIQIILSIIALLIGAPFLATLSCYRLLNGPVEFYGQIIDQDGNPLSGVEIRAETDGVTPLAYIMPFSEVGYYKKTILRKTDNNGLFKIRGHYARVLVYSKSSGKASAFIKDGYEFVPDATPTLFNILSKIFDKNYIKPNPKEPIVYRMRKLNEPTFLLVRDDPDLRVYFGQDSPKDKTYHYDIINDARFNPNKTQTEDGAHLTSDLKITGRWDESKNAWAVTFAAGTENGGIQIQNKQWFVAPSDGYKLHVTFFVCPKDNGLAECLYLDESFSERLEAILTGPHRTWNDKYVFYMVSRGCKLYTKIQMEGPESSEERIRLGRFSIVTNPYAGEHNLETSSNVSYTKLHIIGITWYPRWQKAR